MNSSYLSTLNYSDIFKTICFLQNPKKIVEFGILDGFSLQTFINVSNNKCIIEAYDIFEEFDGNSAKYSNIKTLVEKYDNVSIQYGDFYKLNSKFEDESIDILHIDIANNGDVYEFAIKNYFNKIKKGGVLILEGGSPERDNVEWMTKYNKKSISKYLLRLKSINIYNDMNIINIGTIPSLTLILKNNLVKS